MNQPVKTSVTVDRPSANRVRFLTSFPSVTCLLLVVFSTPAFAGILRSANFENGDYESHNLFPVGNGEPIVVAAPEPVCRGNFSLKLPLDFYTSKYRYRNQMSWGRFNLEYGKDYWVGYAMYIPASIGTPRASMDFHGVADKSLNEYSRSSPLGVYVGTNKEDRQQISIRVNSSAKAVNMVKGDRKPQLDTYFVKPLGKMPRSRWVEVVLHFKVTYQQNGFVDMWIDGKKVVSKRNIGTAYNDAIGPFPKFGIYVSEWRNKDRYPARGNDARRLVYFDEIRFGDGNASYNDVAPRCGGSSTRPPDNTGGITNKLPEPTLPISNDLETPAILDVRVK